MSKVRKILDAVCAKKTGKFPFSKFHSTCKTYLRTETPREFSFSQNPELAGCRFEDDGYTILHMCLPWSNDYNCDSESNRQMLELSLKKGADIWQADRTENRMNPIQWAAGKI